MLISELIAKLDAIKAERGDGPVFVESGWLDSGAFELTSIAIDRKCDAEVVVLQSGC